MRPAFAQGFVSWRDVTCRADVEIPGDRAVDEVTAVRLCPIYPCRPRLFS